MFGGGYEIQKWVCSISFDQQDRICCYSETLQASRTLGVSLSQNTLFWSTLNPPKKTYFHLTSRTPSMFFWEVFPPSSMIFPIIFPPVFHHSIIFPIIFHYVSIILPLFFHRFPIIFHNVPSFFRYFPSFSSICWSVSTTFPSPTPILVRRTWLTNCISSARAPAARWPARRGEMVNLPMYQWGYYIYIYLGKLYIYI